MNYPVWLIPDIGGSFFIALIAITHVYVSHFAVGGGLFLVLSERKAQREKSSEMMAYTQWHAKFFMLLTMVFGSISGVGIWFTISIINPSATSSLIHSFVFGWATEWVFFVGEIVALFVYFYTFGKMEYRRHQIVGWWYFIFAWLSLFIINGIIGYMLTPGKWIETQNFWDGFFNPSFLPSLFFRTFFAIMIAGLFGFVTASTIKSKNTRLKMVRYSARWILGPALLFFLSAYWYLGSISDFSRGMILGGNPRPGIFVQSFLFFSAVVIVGGLIMAIRLPGALKKPLAYFLLLTGLMTMGSFEWLRESARRPYIIFNHMYSNSVLKAEVADVREQGILSSAKWVKNKTVTAENRIDAGREIFNLSCLPCHTIGGPLNDIKPLTENYYIFGMDSLLDGMGKLNGYMPPFMGTVAEREALAAYIVVAIHGKSEQKYFTGFTPQPIPFEQPRFDPETSEYILLAWNDLGMHCISDQDRFFNFLPPANTIFAQLIRRGETPEIITEGVSLSYTVEPDFAYPEKHSDFWSYAEPLYGIALQPGVGLSGRRVSGSMGFKADYSAFVADMIPVVPYPDRGGFNPYPLFTITASSTETGKMLAETACVAPTSTEMGCLNCHSGTWHSDDPNGITPETAGDILSVHDRMNHTSLKALADAGSPVLCQKCHSDHALKKEGTPNQLSLSASIHGFHANHLTGRDGMICARCHPASSTGSTGCLRGIHAAIGLDCASCHGYLEDHALSLLVFEKDHGKPSADRLMTHLVPRSVPSVREIVGREPWINQPDCLHCHQDFNEPEVDTVFNKWVSQGTALFRNRADDTGIMCSACHGSPHALYLASNPYGKDRDNIQPKQYQNNPYPIGSNRNCAVCHLMEMEDSIHHPNMLSEFRNPVE
jgi:hypothetical protein